MRAVRMDKATPEAKFFLYHSKLLSPLVRQLHEALIHWSACLSALSIECSSSGHRAVSILLKKKKIIFFVHGCVKFRIFMNCKYM